MRLINKAVRDIEGANIYPRGNVYLDKVLLGLLSKGFLVAKAVCILVLNDLAEEAFGLSRTLVEISLIGRYLINKQTKNQMEVRAVRYTHYYAKVYSEWLKRAKRHYPSLKPGRNKSHKEFLRKARKYRSPYHWTLPPPTKQQRKLLGTNVSMMAKELDQHEQIGGIPIKWEFDYDWIYFWTSQYVHSTAWALNSHAVELRHPFRIHSNKSLDKNVPGLALFNAAIYLNKLLITVYRGLGHDQPKVIMDKLGDLLKRM